MIWMKSIDIKAPGTFIDYRSSPNDERKLEEHAKKIKSESVARDLNELKSKGIMRVPAGPFELLYSLNSLNSKARHQKQRPAANTCHSIAGVHKRHDPREMRSAVDVGYVKTKPRRRLSLGDISSSLGEIVP
jgi:hypothetical protein